MSRRTQRAVALLMLHHQAMGSGLPIVPRAIFSEACAVAAPLPWWRRILAWVQSRYYLDGWEAAE